MEKSPGNSKEPAETIEMGWATHFRIQAFCQVGKICACLLLLGASVLHAQEDLTINRKYQLIAVYLYHFSSFTHWPKTAFSADDNALHVCVMGHNPFQNFLDELADRRVGLRVFKPRYLSVNDKLGSCHMVYLSQPTSASIDDIKGLNAPGRLLLGEGVEFVKRGGAIGFYTENNKIHIIVNRQAINSAALKISSKLLRLARILE